MKRRLLWVLPMLFLAADAPPATRPGTFDPAAFVIPPPAADSEETKAEFALLLQLQASRTPEQVDRITRENSISISAFTPAVGPWFDAQKLPRVAALFMRVNIAAMNYNNDLKVVFNRPRPGDADPGHQLHPLFEETDPGYPSGHTLCSTLDGLLLCELMPDLKGTLMGHARQLAWDRVIAGMHYPSDIAAAQTLAAAVAHVLLENPNFQNDFAAARGELQAARAAAAATRPK